MLSGPRMQAMLSETCLALVLAQVLPCLGPSGLVPFLPILTCKLIMLLEVAPGIRCMSFHTTADHTNNTVLWLLAPCNN